MAVLVIAEVQGQTEAKYDSMLAVLGPALRHAEEFIAHGAGPEGDGWRTFEIWESQADATQFFATHIHPNLPEGVKPKRTLVQLHSLIFSQVTAGAIESEAAATAGRLRGIGPV